MEIRKIAPDIIAAAKKSSLIELHGVNTSNIFDYYENVIRDRESMLLFTAFRENRIRDYTLADANNVAERLMSLAVMIPSIVTNSEGIIVDGHHREETVRRFRLNS